MVSICSWIVYNSKRSGLLDPEDLNPELQRCWICCTADELNPFAHPFYPIQKTLSILLPPPTYHHHILLITGGA